VTVREVDASPLLSVGPALVFCVPRAKSSVFPASGTLSVLSIRLPDRLAASEYWTLALPV
jgi:hypothetical protein